MFFLRKPSWDNQPLWCGLTPNQHSSFYNNHKEEIITKEKKVIKRIICLDANKYKEVELTEINH